VSIVLIVVLYTMGPIAQDPAYHHFADTRTILGITNFWNVVSNLPFVLVGLFGLWRLSRGVAREDRSAYVVICVALILVAFGSGGYHLEPSNASLLWDRLPMTVAFMALFAMLLGERVIPPYRALLLWPLIVVGIAAALYWAWTESSGAGDLRPYALVQFLPIVLMPLILCLYAPRRLGNGWLWSAIGGYAVAKLLESFDAQIGLGTGGMSGHALKHLAAAAAALCIVLAMPARRQA
jgi:hypothetical protein